MPDQFAEQIKKLEGLRHTHSDSAALEEFDEETERLILQRFGEATTHLEAYELAMMGEAESIVNMPQAAQEDATQDLFRKGLEQRRQVLEACLADLAEPAESQPPSPPAPKPKPRGGKKKPGAAKKKKEAAKRKARPAKKAAKRKPSGPAKKKKPAATRKKKAGSARKKRAKRK